MKEPREIKELLEALKDYVENSYICGLCACISHMRVIDTITPIEASILNEYLNHYLPDIIDNIGYCWEIELKEPRIKWLNEQINNYEK